MSTVCYDRLLNSFNALVLLDKPSFSVDFNGSSQVVLIGGSFKLTCTALGNPTPFVDFVKTPLDSSSNAEKVVADDAYQITRESGKVTLMVRNANTSESGHYFCRASNPAGSVNSRTTTIIVRGKVCIRFLVEYEL